MRDNMTDSWPTFSEDEIEAVGRVLRSGNVNYWTGEECRAFEREFTAFASADHAVALSNGTVALEAALHALHVGRGDEVIVPSRTFIASASCVVMRGAKPVVADVDPVSQNVTVNTLKAAITQKTKAVIVVHLAGWPCDMDPILEFARENRLHVIEDCAQAQGAVYRGRPVGCLGDVAIFSFCQDKIMTTGGEGGMLTTNSEEIWERSWSFKDHGKNYDAVYQSVVAPGFRWLHESFGTNGRMTEMQAAIGRVQLRKVPGWIEARQRHAGILNEFFSGISAFRVAIPPPEVVHSYYKYYVFVRPEALKSNWDRDRIMKDIELEGVPCQSGSCSEIYLEKAFDNDGMRPYDRFPVAQKLGETSLMFLVHPMLTEKDMLETCDAVKRVLDRAML